MERAIANIFDEIDKTIAGTAKIPKDSIRYLEQNIEFYQKYYKSLLEDEHSKEGSAMFVLFSHFSEQTDLYMDLVGNRETQHYKNYETMVINQMNRTAKYSTKVKEEIEREIQEDLYQLLNNTRGKLERHGYLDELYKRERTSLSQLGIASIMPMKRSEVEETYFSKSSFRYRPVPEQLAINLFWINKYWKVIGNSKLAFWLVDTQKQTGTEEKEISDDDKYLAVLREKILDYVQENITQKAGGMSFAEFILCLYMKRNPDMDSKRTKTADEKLKKVPKEVTREFAEIEELYNQYFELRPIMGGQLINDGVNNLYMLTEKKNAQIIKDILTTQLMQILIIDRQSIFPRYNSWGLAPDSRAKAGQIHHIFFMDIPGFIKPLQVHVPDRLLGNNVDKLPKYTGMYANVDMKVAKACTTNFLYRPSTEQAKKLKQQMKAYREGVRKNPTAGDKKIVQTLEYMSAVVNGEMGKLSDIMQETEAR